MSTNKCVPRRKKIDCGAVKEHMPTISGNTQSGQGLSSRFDVACAVDFCHHFSDLSVREITQVIILDSFLVCALLGI